MEPVTLHHLPGTRTLAHGAPLGDYVTRDHLVTRHVAFGSRMLRPQPPDTCRYTWLRPLALVPPTPASSAYITPLARGPCPLASRDGRLLIRERDPRSETKCCGDFRHPVGSFSAHQNGHGDTNTGDQNSPRMKRLQIARHSHIYNTYKFVH